MRHEELAKTILLSPALQRFHTVFRLDRMAVGRDRGTARATLGKGLVCFGVSALRARLAFSIAHGWDRDRARPAVGEGFPFPLFRLQDGFTVSPWRTFLDAPL